MAVYRVRGPDGAVHRFEGPEDATPEQVEAFAAQQFGQSAPTETPKAPNEAAMNPEVHTPLGTIKGEADSGFNPAAYLIKAGDTLNALNQGVTQAKLAPAEWLRKRLGMQPSAIAQGMEQERAESRPAMKDLESVHPGSTALGDATVFMASPNKLAPLVAAAEYGSPLERATKGGVAFAGNRLGEMAGKALGRVAQPTRPGELSQTQALANEAADRLGVKLSAGESSGNRALKYAESATADLPIAAGMATRRSTGNTKAMNTAALRQLGQEGDEITEAVLSKARNDIGGEYDRILNPARIELDTSFRAEVKNITGSKVMKELKDESIEGMLEQFRSMPKGKITVSGEWFQQNKTALDTAIRGAYNNGQAGKAMALERFEKAMDRAAMRSLSTEDRAAYKTAGRQWSTLRALETGKVVENGNVMPGRLDQYLTTRYKGAYKEGRLKGELPDIARLANSLRPPPNSGSVPRAFYTGGIGGAAMAEPLTALTMLAGPASVQALTTSPAMRKYMEKGLLNVTPEMEKWLMRGGGRAGLLTALEANR
jgi:hypothetical protein